MPKRETVPTLKDFQLVKNYIIWYNNIYQNYFFGGDNIMVDNNFNIKRVNNEIIIEKEGKKIIINQELDTDILFTAPEKESSIVLNMHSRNYSESQTHLIFKYLMKLIIGRYILNGDNKKENSKLPKNFIDLDNNIITWYSDGSVDNRLELRHNEGIIKISIYRSNSFSYRDIGAVRIKTNGSRYERYCQEFIEFFRCLSDLEQTLNNSFEITGIDTKEIPIPKKLSLFKREKNKQ